MSLSTIPARQGLKPRLLALAIGTALSAGYGTAHATTFFVVNVGIDNGLGNTEGTLSWAIRQANVNPGADTIDLQTNVTLTGVMKSLIDSDITLQGDEGDPLLRFISGFNENRPLFVKSGNVTIKNLVLTNGKAKGGRCDEWRCGCWPRRGSVRL